MTPAINPESALKAELSELMPAVGKLKANDLVLSILPLFETSVITTLVTRRQLSFAHHLPQFAGATHSRYEHVLGVMAKVSAVLSVIEKKRGQVFSKDEQADVLIAACLHDAGHFPLSHPTERALRLAGGDAAQSLTHEQRVCRLLMTGSPPWDDVVDCLQTRLGLTKERIYGVCWMIDWDYMSNLAQITPEEYLHSRPKKALAQLISSTLDMDRLDYVVRDAKTIKYGPVQSVRSQLLELLRYYDVVQVLREDDDRHDFELCIEFEGLASAFSLLVGRLMMYKEVYFSPQLRSVESTYTRLVGQLYRHRVIADPVIYLNYTDDDFLAELAALVQDLPSFVSDTERTSLRNDLETCTTRYARYAKLCTIKPDLIAHQPNREIFRRNLWNLEFLNSLNRRIVGLVPGLTATDVLCDGLRIRPEKGGTFWIYSGDSQYIPLRELVNGSNIHGLIEEFRLDVYIDRSVTTGNDIRRALRDILFLKALPEESAYA